MPKKAMSQAERIYIGRVVALGCRICGMPAEYHHITSGVGMGQRASHYDGIPLCDRHHRNGGHGVAIHAGKSTWEDNYGSELAHLAAVKTAMAIECE